MRHAAMAAELKEGLAARGIHHIAASMTPEHPRWEEFLDRLYGPEGCDLQENDDGSLTSTCDPSDRTRPACRRIMRRMGLSRREIAASLAYFEQQVAIATARSCSMSILTRRKPRRNPRPSSLRKSLPKPRHRPGATAGRACGLMPPEETQT